MSDDYTAILLEEIRDQNKLLTEAVGDIQNKVNNLPTRDEFSELAQDIKTVKAALTDTNVQVQNHEDRLIRPEAV